MTNTRLLYRLEWTIVALFALWLMATHVDWSRTSNIVLVIFFAVLPDFALLTFPAADGGATWPYATYNALHTLTAWGGVFVLANLIGFNIDWVMLSWVAHIAVDRAVGYALRGPAGEIQAA